MTSYINTYHLKKITKYAASNGKVEVRRLQRRLVNMSLNRLKYDLDYKVINAIDNVTYIFNKISINDNHEALNEDVLRLRKK